MSSCQNHLSLKNIHCRSQTLMSVPYKVGSTALFANLISAVQLLFFTKISIFLFQTCYQLAMPFCFEPVINSCNFCRLGLSGFIEEYIQCPKSNTYECYQINVHCAWYNIHKFLAIAKTVDKLRTVFK